MHICPNTCPSRLYKVRNKIKTIVTYFSLHVGIDNILVTKNYNLKKVYIMTKKSGSLFIQIKISP